MNYARIYDNIILKAQSENRKKSKTGIYYERHHIIPKCLGGSNKKENLILLTAREHFICHWLLARTHPTHFGIVNAFNRMLYFSANQSRYTPSSRAVQEAKELFAKRIGELHKGKKRSSEICKNMSESKKKYNPGLATLTMKGKNHSDKTKEKIRNKLKGIPVSFKFVTCPHCNKVGKENVMYRWHFDNCKIKVNDSDKYYSKVRG